MRVVEETGRSVDEAVASGLSKLGVGREYVLVETLAEGSRGFLGFGGQEARVRLTVTPAGEVLIQARAVLEALLTRMAVQARVSAEEREGLVTLEIAGPDAGLLIGKHGQTLEALQLLVGRILDRRQGERSRVELDVEGYRRRRREHLEHLALRMARQVRATGDPVTLPPMPPGERRIVHLTLQGDHEVFTESSGEGAERCVVIKRASPAYRHTHR